jgi:hypothetical protein
MKSTMRSFRMLQLGGGRTGLAGRPRGGDGDVLGEEKQRRKKKIRGTGREALVAALGRNRMGEARVFPRIRSRLAKRRRRFGVGCSVTSAGKGHAPLVLYSRRLQGRKAYRFALEK